MGLDHVRSEIEHIRVQVGIPFWVGRSVANCRSRMLAGTLGVCRSPWSSDSRRRRGRGRKQDRTPVAGGQDYEVRHTAKKAKGYHLDLAKIAVASTTSPRPFHKGTAIVRSTLQVITRDTWVP
jgi:hypothetical protein